VGDRAKEFEMAGDWIKMRTDLADDPAVIGIASALELSEELVVGKLHRLWSWADRHTADGHVQNVTFLWVNKFLNCEKFAEEMAKNRWLEETENGILFPNFAHHNGESAKKRAVDSKSKKRRRSVRTLSAKCPTNDRTKAGPEKRREEKKREKNKEGESVEAGSSKRGVGGKKFSLPEGFCISDNIRRWADRKGHGQLDEHLEAFIDLAKSRGYKYLDWDAAFRRAIAEDWGKVKARNGGHSPMTDASGRELRRI